MPIKRTFQKNEKNKDINVEQFEKQVKRINTLEVQLKELMRFEKQVRLSLLEAVKDEKSNTKDSPSEIDSEKELHFFNEKLNKLHKRIHTLEQQMNKIESSLHDFQHHQTPQEDTLAMEEWIQEVVEKYLSEKLHDQIPKEHTMADRLDELEHTESNGTLQNQIKDAILQFDSVSESAEDAGDAPNSENSPEMILVERVEKLIENFKKSHEKGGQENKVTPESQHLDSQSRLLEDKTEPTNTMDHQEQIIKTVYIENLHLDKYEQNNNFAQVGIKELSGTLNIGATYGLDAIPKKVVDSIQEDVDAIKANKEKMKKGEGSKGTLDGEEGESESSDLSPEARGFGDVTLEVMEDHDIEENPIQAEEATSDSSQDEGIFTEIDIEEDNEASFEGHFGKADFSSTPGDEEYADIEIEDESSDEEGRTT